MSVLSTAHRAALAAVIDRCPDAVLNRLSRLAPQLGPGPRTAELVALLDAETRNRRRRALVFAPLLPLFRPRADGVEGLSFPAVVLPRLWAAAATGQEAHLTLLDDDEAPVDRVADRLCRAAAGVLRDAPETIWPTTLAPEARDAGLSELTGCLDLTPLARVGVRHVGEWLSPHGDDLTGLRLLLKDAATVAPDGAARMLEILFAHLDDAPAILRVVTRTSSAAAREEFLEGSELADFVARIVRAVRLRVERAAFDPDGGREAVAATVEGLRWSADALTQIDISLQRDPQGEWSREMTALRRDLNRRLVGWIREADAAVRAAAPRVRAKLGARSSRQAADVDAVLDPAAATRALTSAAMLSALRGPAAVFGCEGDRRARLDEAVTDLSDWADEAIGAINAGEPTIESVTLDRVAHVADLLVALEAIDAARTVKRRLSVAGVQDLPARSA